MKVKYVNDNITIKEFISLSTCNVGNNTVKTINGVDIDEVIENIEKAQKYNEHLIRDAKYHLNLGHLKKMDKILKGENDDKVKSNCE